MKHLFFILFASILIASCNNNTQNSDTSDSDSSSVEINKYPNTGNFYVTENDESLIVANPIICDIIVKNPNPANEWMDFCLENADIEAIQNILYNAVYQGDLIPYHHNLDSILPIDSVKAMESRHKDQQIAKLLFEEKWYLNETTYEMYKTVSVITFGYELVNDQGEVYGYKAGFKVYLDQEHNQIAK